MESFAERARAALESSRTRKLGHPAFRAAWEAVVADDLTAAAIALEPLDDPALVLSTMFLERLAIARGKDRVDVLSEPLLRKVPTGALDYGWIARRFDMAWSSETAGHAAPSRAASRDRQGGASSVALLHAVESLLAQSDVDAARELLDQFKWHDKQRAGRAHALVGVALGDTDLMVRAVNVARQSPMIQDGGEETEALGEVLKVFADAGVEANHRAVEACVEALLKLGKGRSPRDVRSFGLRIGALAAARRNDLWSQHARSLIERIWTDALKQPVQLLLAAGGPHDAQELLAAAGLDPELAPLFPDHADDLADYLASARQPLDRARLLRAHGMPDDGLIAAALETASGWHLGVEKLWGQLLLLDSARAHDVFGGLRSPEIALKNAAVALEAIGEFEQAGEYLRRAFDSGLEPDDDCASLLLRAPDLLEHATGAALAVSGRRERMEALSFLSQLYIELGDWNRAGELVDRAIEEPVTEDMPTWVPFSLRGDRASWTPALTIGVPTTSGTRGADALAQVEELAADKQVDAYYRLAFELEVNQITSLRKRMKKAPGGRGDEAQVKKAKLVEVALIAGDIDGALSEAASMRDCRWSGWGPAYSARTLAAWLQANPEQLTPARAHAVLGVIEAAIPQDVLHPLAFVVSALAPLLQSANQAEFLARAHAFRAKFRQPADELAVDGIIAMGRVRCDLQGARELLAGVLDQAQGGFYVGRLFYVRLLQLAGLLPDVELCRRALTIPTTNPPFDQSLTLEHAARISWAAGAQSPIPDLITEGAFPSEVNAQLRRSLVVMAPEHSPDPVETILAVWLDAPPNEAQAKEQIHALADALTRAGRGDEAQEVRAVVAE